MNITLTQSVEHTSPKSYLQIYEELNTLSLSKQETWENWINLALQNKQAKGIECKTLQKLWVKLTKKYKFKFTDWEALKINSNFHEYLLDNSGDGLQHLLHFYQDRHLEQWKIHIFEFGLQKLINQQIFTHLEMFFLTQIICEDWASKYVNFEGFHTYYKTPKYNKTKMLYQAFIAYQQKKESGSRLYKYLASYNPQYNVAAKNTPIFFKKLHSEIQCEHTTNSKK